MTAKVKVKSDAFEAIHSAAAGMHRAGTIGIATMRYFDEACLSVPAALRLGNTSNRRGIDDVGP